MSALNSQVLLSGLLALKGRQSNFTVAGDYPEAAVLVALMEDHGEISVLLTQRAYHLSIHPGESAFPGGKRDEGDASLLCTALREAWEEVALPADRFELLFSLDQRLTRTDIKMTPFVGLIPPGLPLLPNPTEIAQLFTVPLRFFCDRRNLMVSDEIYQGKLQLTPRFRYGDHDVWGVTAMTLIDLVNTAFDAGISLE